MLCSPFLAWKEADLCEKCDNLLYFDDKLSVLTLLLEIFRRLNAISIAFYTPNATHAAFSVESIPTVRKMRPFTTFCRKLSIVSILLETFPRLIAIYIAHYTPNATYAVFSVETIRIVRKMRTFTPFWRKLSVVSLLLDIFRRLNSIFIAFYTLNAMHAVFSVESSPTVRKLRQFTRFCRQTEPCLAIVGDISTFTCYFHSILHSECYACRF